MAVHLKENAPVIPVTTFCTDDKFIRSKFIDRKQAEMVSDPPESRVSLPKCSNEFLIRLEEIAGSNIAVQFLVQVGAGQR